MQKFRRAAQNFFTLTIFILATLLAAGCGDDEPKGEVQTKSDRRIQR